MAKKTTDININKRIDLSKSKLRFPLPNLIEAQVRSYKRFLEEDLVNYFNFINPISDNTNKLWSLEFIKPSLKKPEKTEVECIRKGLNYEAPLYWEVRLVNKQTGEAKEQEIFMGNIPLMSNIGTFIINGVERCIVHQIIRAEGVIFVPNDLYHQGKPLHMAKIIPSRGAWFTINTSKSGILSIKLGPKRPNVNICTFLRALGYGTNAEILNIFKDVKLQEGDANLIETTLMRDPTDSTGAAIFDIYRRLRPDVTASIESAKAYIDSLLFDPKRLYVGDVGRYQLNKKLDPKYSKEMSEENYGLFVSDIVGVIEKLLKINAGQVLPDDVDHLGNRRIRSVNELLGEVVVDAVKKIEKNTKDKMSIHSTDETLTASDVMSSRPLVSAFRDFFGTSQISRYMTQKNVLSEISNLRHITTSGQGGLAKERATFSVRDVHYSQYGRVCPVQTPDGPSIGTVLYLSSFARINRYGFIEVPYRKVLNTVSIENSENRILSEDVVVKDKVILKSGTKITADDVKTLTKAKVESIAVKPYIIDEVVYMDADSEDRVKLTLSQINIDDDLNILDELIPIRHKGSFYTGNAKEVDFIDVDSGVSAGINFLSMPFGNHTEAARTQFQVGNMNQAIPLWNAEAPIVGTGREEEISRLSSRTLYAEKDGVVEYVDSQKIVIKNAKGKEEYNLTNFQGSNDHVLIHHTVRVNPGQKVKAGDLLADGANSVNGELAIGTNILCACMFWEGLTYEDSWLASERLLKNGALTGVLIKNYIRDIRDTKLGPEQLTNDIPGVNEKLLANLDENGIVRRGTKVKAGDILAGVVSPKGDIEVTAEEKLLRAIFGESAHDIKNVSLTMPHGEEGIVIDTQILDRKEEELGTGVLQQVKVWIAKQHTIHVGDKLIDMSGQKGVIGRIVPEEDMPYMPDGTPIDLIFTPLFLKRMNVSLLKEMSLAMKAKMAGVNVSVPLFTSPDETVIDEILKEKGVEFKAKYPLVDGRSGENIDNEVAVGMKYMLKLTHIAEEKIHARSTGPYTIVTQQPLGGKAQFGGQRFGEMEVWALEAHGAANILYEMLTIKSDDIQGRSKAYEAIIHGDEIKLEGTPESFNVFINELRALGLNPILVKNERIETERIENNNEK